jgi:hypothetical protein
MDVDEILSVFSDFTKLETEVLIEEIESRAEELSEKLIFLGFFGFVFI